MPVLIISEISDQDALRMTLDNAGLMAHTGKDEKPNHGLKETDDRSDDGDDDRVAGFGVACS